MKRPRYVKLTDKDCALLANALAMYIEEGMLDHDTKPALSDGLNLQNVLERSMNGRVRLYDPS